jgi:hypothetical protein
MLFVIVSMVGLATDIDVEEGQDCGLREQFVGGRPAGSQSAGPLGTGKGESGAAEGLTPKLGVSDLRQRF